MILKKDLLLLLLLAIFAIGKSQTVLVNHVGYELSGKKIAVVQSTDIADFFTTYSILDVDTKVVYSGSVEYSGEVPGWTGKYYHTIDFSDFQTEGSYRIQVDRFTSVQFKISQNLLFTEIAPSVISFFKNMRHPANKDVSLPFYGGRTGTADVHGGWFDATGDPGKHMSHLSYGNYTNPQQIPFVAWSMMESLLLYPDGFSSINNEITSEIKWGLDYLMRNHDPAGYFYLAVFDDWGGSSNRQICEWGVVGQDNGRTANYQCAFREGGGMAIAALAKAYSMGISGADYTKEQILTLAKSSYTHLKANNTSYCNDGKENILDDYCALMASIELYKATAEQTYLTDANSRVSNILTKQQAEGWFAADVAANRPFFHAADEGMPILALVKYKEIDDSRNTEINSCLTKWIDWYKQISNEIVNPFNYIRQYNKPYIAINTYGEARKSFFLPHDNETGYWWQGENARLASMTTALIYASKSLSSGFEFGTNDNSSFATAQLDWILGKNPFNTCMVHGFGQNNPPSYLNGYGYTTNHKGGICNGISAMDSDEDDIDFMPYAVSDWQNWRWIEQWLPHDAWFLMAISTMSNAIVGGSNYTVPPTVTITAPAATSTYMIGQTVSITATAQDLKYEITQVEFFAGGISLGVDLTAPYSVSWTTVLGGSVVIEAIATNSEGKTASSSINVSVSGQGPYGGLVHQIPGDVIQAEDYDIGGEGVAYHDMTTYNSAGATYRTGDGVDIETCNEGGYNIGYIETGEWLEYAVNIAKAGDYDFSFRVAGGNTGSYFHVAIDGADVTGKITVPNTTGWQTWQTLTVSNKTLPAGIHILRLSFDNGAFNLNSFTTVSKIPDCNGVIGGSAYLDNCNICVGGTTGKVACQTMSIALNKGMNLISTNLVSENSGIESIFAGIAGSVDEVHTLTQKYIPQGTSNTLTTFEAGVGYFVIANQDDTLTITGTPVSLPLSYELQTGWNLVGVPYSLSKSIESFFGTDLQYILEIKNYNEFYNPTCGSEMLFLNTISRGKAYLVKVDQNLTLSLD